MAASEWGLLVFIFFKSLAYSYFLSQHCRILPLGIAAVSASDPRQSVERRTGPDSFLPGAVNLPCAFQKFPKKI